MLLREVEKDIIVSIFTRDRDKKRPGKRGRIKMKRKGQFFDKRIKIEKGDYVKNSI